jgi:hypothetical protein
MSTGTGSKKATGQKQIKSYSRGSKSLRKGPKQKARSILNKFKKISYVSNGLNSSKHCEKAESIPEINQTHEKLKQPNRAIKLEAR